jgi:hypothetical protein
LFRQLPQRLDSSRATCPERVNQLTCMESHTEMKLCDQASRSSNDLIPVEVISGGLDGHRLARCKSRGAANGRVSVVSDRDDGWLDPKSGGLGCDASDEESTRSKMTIQSNLEPHPIDVSSPAQHGACGIGAASDSTVGASECTS